jgi:hypothetical protein
MKRTVVTLFALCLCLFSLGAQGAGLAFRSDKDVGRALAEYAMSGKLLVTDSFVFTGNELAEIADYSGRVQSGPDFKSRLIFQFDPGIKGVSGIPAYVPATTSDPTLLYFIDGIPVFLDLGADFSSGDKVAGKVKIDLALRPTQMGANDMPLFAPWMVDTLLRDLLSWKFPQEGWLSAGDQNAWIAAGRFKSGLGEGHFGNTFLNSRAEYYDQVQGVVGNKNFRFTSLIGNSATHLNKTEGTIQYLPRDTYYATDISINSWDAINDHDFTTQTEPIKMFAYSQVEARFWDRFRFGIAQMNMIGGKYPSLTDILPTMFWHNNYSSGYTNVMLGLNAAVLPIDGLELFGEFTLDDTRGADEPAISKPSAYAWQTGGRYSFKPTSDIIVTAGGEYSFVSEWAYSRWQPYLTMYQRHLINPSQGTDWPLGFAYGPDAKHLGFFATASLPSGATAELAYEYLVKGPIYMGMTDSNGNPIYYNYDMPTFITLPDTPRTTTLAAIEARPDQLSHGLSLNVNWPLPLGFETYGRLQYWNHSNYLNAPGDSRQFVLFSTGVLWRY